MRFLKGSKRARGQKMLGNTGVEPSAVRRVFHPVTTAYIVQLQVLTLIITIL